MGYSFDIKGRFQSFIEDFTDKEGDLYYYEKIRLMERQGSRSLNISYNDLLVQDSKLAEEIVINPEECFQVGVEILKSMLAQISPEYLEKINQVYIRIEHMSEKLTLRSLKTEHLGLLTCFEGIVIGVTAAKPMMIRANFKCVSCGEQNQITDFPEGIYNPPYQCRNEQCQRKGSLILQLEKSIFIDWQKITLQERPEELPPGQLPQNLLIHVIDDLVDQARPGDRIEVVGILKARSSRILKRGQLATYSKFFQGVSIDKEKAEYVDIDISEEDELKIIDLSKSPYVIEKIRDSLAPSIYGHDDVKEAIASLLFGGTLKEAPDGIKLRGESNILLIGDPGVGKCVHPESEILLATGERQRIGDLVESNITEKNNIDDGFYGLKVTTLMGMDYDGKLTENKSDILWKRKSPKNIYIIKTLSGRQIKVTPTHPFFCCENGYIKNISAENLTDNTFIAVPRKLTILGDNQLSVAYQKSKSNNAIRLIPPKSITPWFAEFLGLFLAEGYSQDRGNSKCIWFCNSDKKLLVRFKQFLEKFGVNYNQRLKSNETTYDVYCGSSELYYFLEALEPSIVKKSKDKRVPNQILRGSDDIVSVFLKAFFDGEACIYKSRPKIELASASYNLLSDVQLLLLRFNIISHIKEKIIKMGTYYRLNITGLVNIRKYHEKIGFSLDYKSQRLSKYIHSTKIHNTNVDVIPNVGGLIRKIRTDAGLYQSNFTVTRSAINHYERNDGNPSRRHLRTIVEDFRKNAVISSDTNILEKISSTDIYWDKISEISKIPTDTDWVYDLQVPGVHNYIANGFFVHNSQILKFISKLAPRAIYTTGKGSTAAGLTAAVLRDPDTGEITLEAGALVLADQGIAMVDEFDKMRPDDRVAIHEAMEQHTISIAKAGIVATLNARTSILAAANPRRGRWNPYRDPAENLNLPSTLLSRFDLLFVLEDKPHPQEDHDKATHILNIHQSQTLSKDPPIDQDLLRKYIAYARQKVHPRLTDEAKERILEYYKDLRQSSGIIDEKGPDPIAITPRQLESLVRLSEARAKMRLSDEVSYDDAAGAVNLMNSTLEKLAKDTDTGKLDIDRMSSGHSAKSRRKLDLIDNLIDRMIAKAEDEPVAIKDIIDEAIKEGLDKSQVVRAIDEMTRRGILFEPETGHVKKP